jgi:hypothetical protein
VNRSYRQLGAVFIAASSAVLLASCASTAQLTDEARDYVEVQKSALAATPPCCASPGDIAFLPATATLSKYEVSSARARVFPEGKSHFVAVTTPDLNASDYIVVKSNPVSWRRHGLRYVFSPSVVAYDREHVESGKWVDLPLCYSQGWSREETGYFAALRVDPQRHSYLIFHTTNAALTESTHYSGSSTAGGIGYAVSVAVEYDFPHSPVGEIEVGPMSHDLQTYLEKRCPKIFLRAKGE